MVSSLYLLLCATTTVLATRPHAHTKRQDSVAPSITKAVSGSDAATPVVSVTSSTSLDIIFDLKDAQTRYLEEVCSPNYNEFVNKYLNVRFAPEDWDELMKKLGESKFPCEQQIFHHQSCIGPFTDDSRDAKAEQDCLCSSNFFEMMSACFDCSKVHGFDPLEMDYSKAAVPALQTAFCSATKPVFYGDAFTSKKDISYTGSYTGGDMMKFITGTDLYPSQTDISYYYTAASATTTAASSGAAQTTGSVSSDVPVAATTSPAPNGAGQLKAASGIAVAFLGVIAAL